MSREQRSAVERALVAGSLVAALLIPLLSCAALFPLVINMPTWDQWSEIEVFSAHYEGRPVLPLLLKPYNGHLNIVPRVIFYVMGVATHWNIHAEIAASWIIAFGTLTLLLIALARQKMLILAAPVSAQAFSMLQFENFLSGYPMGQNLSQFLSTLAIVLLTLPRVPAAAFATAAVAVILSTFSWGAGLAGWYVGVVVLVLRRERSRWRWAIWLALTLAMTLVVKMSASGAFGAIPWKSVVSFFLSLLGKAWSPYAFPITWATIRLGAIAFVFFALLVAWHFWKGLVAARLPWIALGLLALAASGLIALGRASSGLPQSLASHYVTATYTLVVACIALSYSFLQALAQRWKAVMALAVIVVVLPVLHGASIARQSLPSFHSWKLVIYQNSLAISRGTASDEQIRASHHPDVTLVRSGVDVLRAHRLAWFHDFQDGSMAVGSVDRIAQQRADAPEITIDAGQPWSIEGWAVRSRSYGGEVKGVSVYVDGKWMESAQLDLQRNDVMDFYKSAGFLNSGWTIPVPPDAVEPGRHRLWIAVMDFGDGLHVLFDRDVQFTSPARSDTH